MNSEYLSFQFKLGAAVFYTVNIEKKDLVKLVQKDTIKLQVDEGLYLINAINSYSRSDGPGLKVYSITKQSVNLVKRAGALEITDVESLVGKAEVDESLVLGVAEERFTVQIEREKGEVEFILKGITTESQNWSRRIIIKDWDSFIFIE